MRGKVAKRIRKEVYGDLSLKQKRRYVWVKGMGNVVNDPKSLRAKYQVAKKRYTAKEAFKTLVHNSAYNIKIKFGNFSIWPC